MFPALNLHLTCAACLPENCRLPSNVPASKVVERIRCLVQDYGKITSFKAYMDVSLECGNTKALTLQSDLQSSGITLVHCPHNGKKDVADKMMIGALLAHSQLPLLT